MKKTICFILLLFVLLFSLTACFETTLPNDPDTGKTDDTTPPDTPNTGKTDNPNTANEFEAIHAALADVQAGKTGPIPRQLQNKHYDGADAKVKGQFYKYPHEYENHWVEQQYLPDVLKGTQYYHFGDNKTEQAAHAYWERVKKRKL